MSEFRTDIDVEVMAEHLNAATHESIRLEQTVVTSHEITYSVNGIPVHTTERVEGDPQTYLLKQLPYSAANEAIKGASQTRKKAQGRLVNGILAAGVGLPTSAVVFLSPRLSGT